MRYQSVKTQSAQEIAENYKKEILKISSQQRNFKKKMKGKIPQKSKTMRKQIKKKQGLCQLS